MAKILLTGATGFIGNGLVPKLNAAGHEVTCLIRQGRLVNSGNVNAVEIPRTLEEMTDILKELQPDVVVHLASLFLASHTPNQSQELIESNVAFPARLLEAMKGAGIRCFLNTGTIFQSTNGEYGSPFNLYAATKQAFEEIASHYSRNENFKILTIRLADTFGVGDTRRKVVQLLIEHALARNQIDLSPGEQKISLTWIDDITDGFVDGVYRILNDTASPYEVFGVCNPELVSIRDLARLIEAQTDCGPIFNWGGRDYRPKEIMEPVLPLQLPGWAPKISLEIGISRLIAANRISGL